MGGAVAGQELWRLLDLDSVAAAANRDRQVVVRKLWGFSTLQGGSMHDAAGPLSRRSPRRLGRLRNVLTLCLVTALVALAPVAGAAAAQPGNAYHQTNLVSDLPGMAQLTDPGLVTGWNPGVPPPPPSTQAQVGASVPDAVYKGLAIASTADGTFLYAANFHAGQIDVFDSGFNLVHLSGSFQDPKIPSGFAPFNIQELGGLLYVTYAKQDAARHDDVAGQGLGFVDVYSTSGQLLRHLIERGQLNAPWGLVLAPAGFGRFGGDLLVGNFGDGRINAYDPATGGFRGRLKHEDGSPIQIDGLWALRFGNGVIGNQSTMLFSAGIDDEAHGLFGAIEAAH